MFQLNNSNKKLGWTDPPLSGSLSRRLNDENKDQGRQVAIMHRYSVERKSAILKNLPPLNMSIKDVWRKRLIIHA